MPRSPRLFLAGGVYHVTTRGIRRQNLFFDDVDAARFLEILAGVIEKRRWRCHCYCLMPNHYHLVVETPDADLSAGMHVLNGRYANFFNQRHGFAGHVFESRFHPVLVETTPHLVELARYLALNPVRGGLCRRPRDWRWSSYRAYTGDGPRSSFLTLDWLLGQFGSDRARATRSLEAFVRDGTFLKREPAQDGPVSVPGTGTRPGWPYS